MNGTLDMSGNVKFDDTYVNRTWFGPDLRGGENIDGGGWTMMKNKPPGLDAFDEYTSNNNSINFIQDSGIEGFSQYFSCPTSKLTFTPDEILITSIASDGQRVWWILDYTIATNVSLSQDWTDGTSVTLKSTTVIKASSSNVSHITHVYSWENAKNIFSSTLYFNEGAFNPSPWKDYSHPQLNNSNASQFNLYRAEATLETNDYNHSFLYHQGASIFFRDSTNIQANPKPYPTMIKKEPDHLHITAPLNIYPEGNYELDDLGLSGDIYLKFDGKNGTDANVTVDNAGGWYLVRQANEVASSLYEQNWFYMDRFHFGISYGTKQNGDTYPSGHFYTRNVKDYDYDEVLFLMIDPDDTNKILWQIWDRTALETLMSRYDGINLQVTGVKKSSQSTSPHSVEAAVRSSTEPKDPGIGYSYPGNGAEGGVVGGMQLKTILLTELTMLGGQMGNQ